MARRPCPACVLPLCLGRQSILLILFLAHPSFLSQIIPNYSELSGFVHGGPSTSLILDALPTEAARADELLQDADLVVTMFFSTKRWLLMFAVSARPDFQPQLDQFNEAIARFG